MLLWKWLTLKRFLYNFGIMTLCVVEIWDFSLGNVIKSRKSKFRILQEIKIPEYKLPSVKVISSFEAFTSLVWYVANCR